MLMITAAIVAGFVFLVWGADRFVMGASATARTLGVSPLIVGLTIVGFGTSAPEMLVSGMASWQGNPGIAVGNAIGSNITNIALVLGITVMVKPLVVHSSLVRRELPVLLLVMLLGWFLISDGHLGVTDGVVLLLGMVVMIALMVWTGLRSRDSGEVDALETEFDEDIPKDMPLSKALMWLAIGLVVLVISSRILIWGAVELATMMGISDLVIGLTIIAIGTSLPELAAAVMSVLRDEHDIAIGNVVGSNMFNLLGVMALPGVIAPDVLAADVLIRDYPLMLMLTVAFLVMAYGFRGKAARINRFEGGALLAVYVGYMVVLYRASM